jgi:hypothetical protein
MSVGYDETAELPASDQPAAGGGDHPSAIGRFVVRGRLGEGGMGVVLDAWDPALARRVAIKLVRADADSVAYHARLVREAAAMARVEHPNVVRVYEVGSDRGRTFVAMELVEGTTLRAWLREPRSRRDVLAMFAQVGAGLAAVHRGGLVHRDFKPDNVLVDRLGHARVADFGLARLDRSAADPSPALQTLTQTGALMGTPGYMAPEQALGVTVDARADQYSFCVALREALRGELPADLRALLARGLSYDPQERFASMDDLLAALAGGSRSRRRLAIGAVVVVLVGGGATATALALRGDGGEVRTTTSVPRDAAQIAIAPPSPPVSAPRDAAVQVAAIETPVAPPRDAGVAAPPPRHNAAVVQPPRDAGVATRAVDAATAPAIVPPATGSAAPSRRRFGTHEIDPAHVAAAQTAIRNLGYTGSRGDDVDDLRRQRDAASDALTAADLDLAIGLALRKRGDCRAALKAFGETIQDVGGPRDRTDKKWLPWARAVFNQGLCSLALGQATSARSILATAHQTICMYYGPTCTPEHSQVVLAHAIASWETGDNDTATEMFGLAKQHGDDALRATMATWAKSVGADLP